MVATALVSSVAREARADDAAGAPAEPPPLQTAPLARESTTDVLLAPSSVGAAPLVLQTDAGFAVSASVRQRQVGTTVAPVVGSEVDARLSVSRQTGRLTLVVDGMVRRAIGTRDDADALGGGRALIDVGHGLQIGAEGRIRGEIVEGIVAADDEGRPVEVITGAATSLDLRGVVLQGLGGFCWPRGPAPAGPAVLGGIAFAF